MHSKSAYCRHSASCALPAQHMLAAASEDIAGNSMKGAYPYQVMRPTHLRSYLFTSSSAVATRQLLPFVLFLNSAPNNAVNSGPKATMPQATPHNNHQSAGIPCMSDQSFLARALEGFTVMAFGLLALFMPLFVPSPLPLPPCRASQYNCLHRGCCAREGAACLTVLHNSSH